MDHRAGAAGRIRAGVVLWNDDALALIERVRHGRTYYVLPGGGAEFGETVEDGAARECFEELGLRVRIGDLAASVYRQSENTWQYYFYAVAIDGTFGSGQGPEYGTVIADRGTYRPVWILRSQLAQLDVRPRALALALALCDGSLLTPPLTILES